jgi:hypothetical protein
MAAGPTYELIATTTLSSNENEITFSSIPGTYTDLVFVVQAQSNSGGSSVNGMRCRINGNAGNNYSYTSISGAGGSVTSGRETNVDYFIPGEITQTSNDSRSLCIFTIMSYTNTNIFKSILSRGNTNVQTNANIGLYRSTSAVTSVSISRNFFVDSVSKVKSGSIVSLYGIKSA